MEPSLQPLAPSAPLAEKAWRAQVAAFFGRLTPRYDLFNRIASLGLDPWWRRRTVRAARVGPGDRVLDLAAGTGDLTLALARRRPAFIASTDLVPSMLARGMEKAAAARISAPVAFGAVDACALPFADESFDVATVAFGVRNFANRASHFSEARRVLRPGGRYVILEFTPPPRGWIQPLYTFYLEQILARLGKLLTGDVRPFEHLAQSIQGFPEAEDLADELRDAGFQKVAWETMTFGVVAIHRAVR